jgi:hypothetical protein
MNLIQDDRKTRGCSWDGGECVFFDINSGQCNLLETIDWYKAEAARDLRLCRFNFTNEEMLCLLEKRAKQRQKEIIDEIWNRKNKVKS